jgi:outer membrane protein OmpA-like peptidoglycan-associated protein
MRMRMDTLEDMLLSFDDMGDYFGSNGGFDGNRHYLSGYSFALYLEERFGEGVYQSFALNREASGWTPNWLAVIEETLNISADELAEDWVTWLNSKYTAVQDEILKDPAIGERVVFSGVQPYYDSLAPSDVEKEAVVKDFKGGDKYQWRRAREKGEFYTWGPKFSADGSRVGVMDVFTGIQIMEVDETRLTPFTPEAKQKIPFKDAILTGEEGLIVRYTIAAQGDSQFDFSPDGTKIVYVCGEDDPQSKLEAEGKLITARTLDLDGYRWHQLCIIDLVERTQVMDDFLREKLGYLPSERAAMKLDMERRGIKPPKFKSETDEFLKAKEKHWVKWVEGGIGLMNFQVIGGDTPERRVSTPAWSPDGNLIAYTKYADIRQELWIHDLAAGTSRALTSFADGTRFEGIDWSPDGTEIVVGAYRWNQQDIYVFDVTTGEGRPLTMDRFEDRDPHWGHDGNIYFTSDRVGGIYNVFRLDPRLQPGVLDTDLDGILDHDDQCPTEPETRNLYKDSDGCPDTVPVRVTADKIDIAEKVFFELDKAIIKEDSFELLNAVARVLVENPQLLRVEVAGHTDSQGDEDYNQELSERRAAAVADYLIGRGVDAERLSSAGYGQSEPLVEGDTEEVFATNRRVEFNIEQQSKVTEIVEQETDTDSLSFGCGEGPEAERLSNAYLLQITNVVSGAFTPSLTPSGHLMYSNYTPFGWKTWGLHCSEFHNDVVDDTTLVIAKEDYGLDGPQEVYPDYSAVTSPVRNHAEFWRNALVIPIINLGNISLTHVGIDIGIFFAVSDALDTNSVSVYMVAGEQLRLQIFYQNKRLWTPWRAFVFAGILKFDYGILIDDDGSNATLDDQFLVDGKQGYSYLGGGAGINFPFAPIFDLDLASFGYGRAIKTVSDGKKFRPLDFRFLNSVTLEVVSPKLARSARRGGANPRGGRAFSFSWSPNYVVSLNRATGGITADDGQIFGNYFFNEFHLRYTEAIALPWKKPNGEKARHTLQITGEFGIIDRNVPFIDEIRGGAGGGVNRSNVLQSATTFAGYEPFSLAGETAAILNVLYRFPLARNIDVKVGPLYIESIHMQFFGTVGNFWSYALKEDAQTADLFGERVLVDVDDRTGGGLDRAGTGVYRETPLSVASENGNAILADAGVELRFSMNLFNRAAWFSSIRIAYGFMGVTGRGDVDGDDIYTNASDPTLDNRSSEREPAGFRFMIGIGQGW